MDAGRKATGTNPDSHIDTVSSSHSVIYPTLAKWAFLPAVRDTGSHMPRLSPGDLSMCRVRDCWSCDRVWNDNFCDILSVCEETEGRRILCAETEWCQ
ncbi:hypothetical protein SERLA73DRAFT_175794 [Serpula lacrymans var. lacrymans S7.3]|uniref:Uncharacterized protein n=2 Tax=Serpula lacrymans var. lacrymans TaxID=341189 RepID=F8PIW4_SERL3|nr:uncharacterized protein SERLADRAFT_458397 [Serpula lacrymans var. lacrymans S7.9]EGO04064.1 hypothetical protein SERLA73DRAFT_175794 [Serpula lacrymans var. lacrymans S7.3]EGO29981.1 hypothetical protein SERLADRAFT_458397 [Serpula lacrymans var. lacrymans S7.9]